MPKIKIRFLINTLAGGGAEKVLVDLLNCLDPAVFDMTLCVVSGGVHEERIPEAVKIRRIINGKRFCNLIGKIIYNLPLSLLRIFFFREKVDIDIAYLEGFPTRVVSRSRQNKKKVAFVHCDVSSNDVLERCYKTRAKCISDYLCFDKICFVSENAREGFIKKVD